jgi:hypothetical protein
MQTGIGIGVGTAFKAGVGGASGTVTQPIALISPTTGAVFVNAEGKVLTRGVRRVKPQES